MMITLNSKYCYFESILWVMERLEGQEVLLTPAEVAKLFRVDPKTVTRWAKAGKITAIRTLGGHRRYRQSEIVKLIKTTHTSLPNEKG